MSKKKIIDLNESNPKKKSTGTSKVSKVKTKPFVKVFANAPGDHYFILCNGQAVKNIRELADVLETVDDGVFYYHVNAERNDFAVWIKDIFKEDALAEELKTAKDKGNTRIIIYRHLLNCLSR